jgi:SAM-dependent methyltransferase
MSAQTQIQQPYQGGRLPQTVTLHGAQCRFCRAPLRHRFVDLGMSPPCQTHVTAGQLNDMERFYPLLALVCERCFLVQLLEYVAPAEIFTEYAYFSSYADSWVEHCRRYCEKMRGDLGLGAGSLVVELASNDGYLLQHFVRAGVPVLGIEPAANVAKVAVEKGVRTEVAFFGVDTAKRIAARYGQPDLLLGNNVLAHVPDLNDFVAGMKILLKRGGLITMEFPHLVQLMQNNQFDTIYHEHFSYFSFTTVSAVFAAHGLQLFDVEELPTHGGSLRIYGAHADDRASQRTQRAEELLATERRLGMDRLETYRSFEERVKETKRKLLECLIAIKRAGKSIAGFGAPGKGNTLLNYCGIRTDFLDYTIDRNPYKQGKFTPGTHIPILHPDAIEATRPDYVLILPWNLRDEAMRQLVHIRSWGGKFIVPIPEVAVID